MKIMVFGPQSIKDVHMALRGNSEGGLIVCRPLKSNVPDGKAGWTETDCPKCGQLCWKTAMEPDPLPAGFVAYCTLCALNAEQAIVRKG